MQNWKKTYWNVLLEQKGVWCHLVFTAIPTNLLWSAPSAAPWEASRFRCLFLVPHEGVPRPQMSGLCKTWWLCPCSGGLQSTVHQGGTEKGKHRFNHLLRKMSTVLLVAAMTHRFIKLFACLCGINFAWEGDSGHSGVQGVDDAVIYGAHCFQHLLIK